MFLSVCATVYFHPELILAFFFLYCVYVSAALAMICLCEGAGGPQSEWQLPTSLPIDLRSKIIISLIHVSRVSEAVVSGTAAS